MLKISWYRCNIMMFISYFVILSTEEETRTMQRNPSSDFPSREDLLWLPGGPQFIPDTERSTSYERVYRMASGYGEGTLRALDFNNLFAVLTADFVPRMTFEHTANLEELSAEHVRAANDLWTVAQ